MKILIVPSWYPTEIKPISGVFFQEQALALKKQGIKVIVAYPEIRSLKDLNRYNTKSGYSKKIENGVKTYRKRGYNYVPRSKRHVQKKYGEWLENLLIKIMQEEGKPDILHAHSVIWGGWAASRLAEKYNIPLIVTEHSSMFTRNLVQDTQGKYIIETLNIAEKVIAVGPSLKQALEAYTKKEIEILPNIVNTKLFSPNDCLKRNVKFRFFSLAILTPNKGMDVLLKAFSRTLVRNANMELIIGGDGPEREYLEELSKELEIDNYVSFVGNLDRNQVVFEMKKCDAFVLASKSETFGVVYVEALASGKPVIATKCGGPEMIVDSSNGLLVEIDNIEELAQAMLKISLNYLKYDPVQLSMDCEKKFGEKSVTNKLIEHYKSIKK